MSLVLTLIDEINCHLDGLKQYDIDKIVEGTKIADKGAFMTAAYQTGNWDGKISYFDEETCIFFQYMLDDVFAILENKCGYAPDAIEIVDERVHEDLNFDDIDLIDNKFLYEALGFDLRPYQVDGANAAIQQTKGILEYATAAGKSLTCAAIAKAFEHRFKSFTIVPSAQLVTQTAAEYKKAGLDVVALTAKVAPKKRPAVFKKHTHVVVTGKLLMNCIGMFDSREWIMMVDETHRFGEEFGYFVRTELNDCPVRIGLTGTVPSDKLKRRLIECHLGGTVLDEVSTSFLMDNGFVATTDIDMIKTRDPEIEEFSETSDMWDWDKEFAYYTNSDRVEAIANYLKTLEPTNTLVLCHPQLGVPLSAHFDGRMIVDETPIDTREKWLSEYNDSDEYLLCASWGTSGTGLSVNKIFRLVLIDVGKNEVYIRQGIGRGLRLDGEVNHCEVIDISADTKYAKRHRKDRIKIYKQQKFKYVANQNYIQVNHE